jgi:eukaryotic-like serine/threonine-protein kinase
LSVLFCHYSLETFHMLLPDSLAPGSVIGSWRLQGLVSQSPFGVVFRAERTAQPDAGLFALKLAFRSADPRYANEADLLSRTHHPNLPRLHDSGQWTSPGGALFPYLVIDWVHGLPLYSWSRLKVRTSREQLRVLAQAASALQAVHEAGGIHRDFKGDSLMVRSEDDHVLLVDFGSCLFRGAPVPPRDPEIPGTPQYDSPQSQLHQWKYRREAPVRYEATVADDVYALGVTAYRLTTGRYPLIAEELSTDTPVEELFSHFPELVPADAVVQLSPELARRIRQMLSVEPEPRGTSAELAAGLALAADTEGPAADQSIVQRMIMNQMPEIQIVPTSSTDVPWHVWFKTTIMSALIIAGGGYLLHAAEDRVPTAYASAHIAQAQAPAPDSYTSGLGELTLPELLNAQEPTSPQKGVSAAVPTGPLPGQRMAPCKGPQLEINGGCWFQIGNETPPCSEITYEWRKRCYLPAMGPQRPSTTGEK